jgi:LysR family transcriptional activator of nhaA
MDRLNYHHLLYFFTVAHEGSVARASVRLGLTQPTVSAQIHALEQKLGRKLMERSGRGLKLTSAGETVMHYAGSIFAMGKELQAALDGHIVDGHIEAAPPLSVGVSTSFPPALVATLLHAVLDLHPRPLLTIVEATPETLAAQLAAHSLHFALTDVQTNPRANSSGVHSRVLLESSVALFAPEALSRKLRKNFPSHLGGAPVLMTTPGALRKEVERWLTEHRRPVERLAEMPHPESFALRAKAAIFAPWLLREPLHTAHGLLPVGELAGSRWRAFAITAGKSVKHPALDAVIEAARKLH